MNESPRSSEEMVLYAWVGRNDDPETRHNDKEHGIKQGYTPLGLIPLVACKEDRMQQDYIVDQMKVLAKQTGLPRQLVRFKFDGVIKEVS